jgi:hypothetical protein
MGTTKMGTIMRKIIGGLATLGLLAAVLAMAATTAQASDLSFKVGYTIMRGPVGSLVDIGGENVPEDLQGRTCDVALSTSNNGSVHVGNDVIISSGDGSVTFKNVESKANQDQTYPAQPLTLGGALSAQLRFGKDKVTSSGFGVTVDCPPPPTVPPTTEPPTTLPPTTEPPVTVPPTTEPPTTEPPVVEVCVGEDAAEVCGTSITVEVAEPAPPIVKEPQFTG